MTACICRSSGIVRLIAVVCCVHPAVLIIGLIPIIVVGLCVCRFVYRDTFCCRRRIWLIIRMYVCLLFYVGYLYRRGSSFCMRLLYVDIIFLYGIVGCFFVLYLRQDALYLFGLPRQRIQRHAGGGLFGQLDRM